MSATWQNLPYRFKQNVVELLDFKSRGALQMCSKQDDYVVRKAPLTIYCFRVAFQHEEPNKFEISVKFEKNSEAKHKKQNLEATCATILRMLSKKNTFIESFHIALSGMVFPVSTNAYEMWSKLLELEFQINCKQFAVWGKRSDSLREEDFVVWRFLQRANPKHLKSLAIKPRISENELTRIMESEQFRKSKEIYIKMNQNYEGIKRMLSADNFKGAMEGLKVDEAWQLIKSFVDKPVNSNFTLRVNKEMDLTAILGRAGVLYPDPGVPSVENRRCEISYTLTFRRRTSSEGTRSST